MVHSSAVGRYSCAVLSLFAMLTATSCASGQRYVPWTHDQTSSAAQMRYILSIVPPQVDVAQLTALAGPPPFRFGMYLPAMGSEYAAFPTYLHRVELYGYVTAPNELTRFLIVNTVVVARETLTVPSVPFAEQGQGTSAPPTWAIPTGISKNDLVAAYGTPSEKEALAGAEVLAFGGGRTDVAIVTMQGGKASMVFSMRAAHPSAGYSIATMMTALTLDPGQLEQRINDVTDDTLEAVKRGHFRLSQEFPR